MSDQLAINGGAPIRTRPLPSISDSSGRTFGDEELANLTEVIRSGRLFRFGGHFVADFESAFAGLLGMEQAVAVTSGTAAIHTALATLDLEPGDEVIVPPITDMGTIVPILALNAIPVFADVGERTLCLDPASVAQRLTPRTRAIIAVHLGGNVCDMDALGALGQEHRITVVEDCAQAALAEDRGRLVGTMGRIAAFSLQQSKHVASGDGGLVVTSDPELARRARLYMDKGWDREAGGRAYLYLGLNYRMNELTGAVACAQVGKLAHVVERRRQVAARLAGHIADVPHLESMHIRDGVSPSWWFYPAFWDSEKSRASMQDFCAAVTAEGIPVGAGYIGRPIFDNPAMQEHRTYGKSGYPYGQAGRDVRYSGDDVSAACRALERLVVIPVNENFTDLDVDDIAEALRKVAAHLGYGGCDDSLFGGQGRFLFTGCSGSRMASVTSLAFFGMWAERDEMTQFTLSHGLLLADSVIAASALEAGEPLHTRNVRYFRFIPGLMVTRPY